MPQDICGWVPDMLNEYHRDQSLKYLKGTKREAMNMAFDRARDRQVELINQCAATYSDKDRKFILDARHAHDEAVARFEERQALIYARKLNRRFKLDKPSHWWLRATAPHHYKDIVTHLVTTKVGPAVTAVRERLNEFRKSLNPQPSWATKPGLTPQRKAKVVKKKNSAAVKLLTQFTDSLEESEASHDPR